MKYEFNPAEVTGKIKTGIIGFAEKTGGKIVLGISGGKDSTICAKLCADAIGRENVYGVMMPNGQQGDLCDSLDVIKITGINSYAIDIKNPYETLVSQLEYNGIKPTSDTLINIGPRLRMTTLYAVSQTVGGGVICTDNLDERITGYFTFYGDGAGGYAPLRNLTVGEVIAIGKYLGLPDRLVEKKPGDGLQPLGDEDRIGFKYADIDNFIRYGIGTDELKNKIIQRYRKNKFKTDIVDIPGPEFDFPNYVFQ